MARWVRRTDPADPRLAIAQREVFRQHTARAGTGTGTDPMLYPNAWRAAVLPALAEWFGLELAGKVIDERLAADETAAEYDTRRANSLGLPLERDHTHPGGG